MEAREVKACEMSVDARIAFQTARGMSTVRPQTGSTASTRRRPPRRASARTRDSVASRASTFSPSASCWTAS